MTQEQIDKLRELEGRATPGPWGCPDEGQFDGRRTLYSKDDNHIAHGSLGYYHTHSLFASDGWHGASYTLAHPEDAELICAMRNELLALLDDLAAAQADNAQLRRDLHTAELQRDTAQAAYDTAASGVLADIAQDHFTELEARIVQLEAVREAALPAAPYWEHLHAALAACDSRNAPGETQTQPASSHETADAGKVTSDVPTDGNAEQPTEVQDAD